MNDAQSLSTQQPELICERIAGATARVDALKADLQHALYRVLGARLPDLRVALAEQQTHTEALRDLVTAQGPDAYPEGARSQSAHGVRYGWQRTKPRLVVSDHGRSIAAARQLYRPRDVDAIVDTVERLRVSALGAWTDDDLARIHVRREPGEDQPFVRGAAGDLERLAKAITAQALDALDEQEDAA